MQEKDMVNDVLSMTKASLTSYARVIAECSNRDLRHTLQQIRDADEQFQYQLYQLAEQKNYYHPAQTASLQDVQQVKSMFEQGGMMN
jgi:spore coat protein CotF